MRVLNTRRLGFLYGSLFLGWILVFFIQRLIFLGYYSTRFFPMERWDVFKALYAGLRLDLSTAGYLMILPVLTLILRFFFSDQLFLKTLKGIVFLELFMLSIIHAGEIAAYSEWGHKLSSRVFMHLLNPDEVMRTTGFSKGALSFLIILIELFSTVFLINRVFHRVVTPDVPDKEIGRAHV